MNEYHIMFRNGDGVTLKGSLLDYDENYIRVWDGTTLVAVFSWNAIVGFIKEEVG